MRVFVSSFQCESNTFCKEKAKLEDFDLFFDEQLINKLAASKVFIENNIDIVPGVYASALPSGEVDSAAYKKISNEILVRLKNSERIDGIYLYLHGAMVVEDYGSGEARLVAQIRDVVGYDIPIAVALDFHANNSDEFVNKVNIIQSFRTAPHTDHDQTEIRAAQGLIRCMREKVLPKPVIVRVPLLAADTAVTAKNPLKRIMKKIYTLDSVKDFYAVAFFNGQPWADLSFMGPSVVIMYKNNKEECFKSAYTLAEMYWQGRKKLKFGKEAMNPSDAIACAAMEKSRPVFITDSGDNTTAGAEGEGTLMLKLLLEKKTKDTLVCAITAKEITKAMLKKKIGDTVHITLGKNSVEKNILPITIDGKIKAFGKVLGWAGEECGNGVTIDCGNIDVVLTDVRAAFISKKHIENMGISVYDYKIIVLKLGYLFPDLKQVTEKYIFALTPGSSTNLFDTIDYKHIRRPMYPIDSGFDWNISNGGKNNE